MQGKEIESLKEVLEEAKEKNLPISIAGKQHSMGGHTYYENGIVLDMTKFRRIVSFNEKRRPFGSRAAPHGMIFKNM